LKKTVIRAFALLLVLCMLFGCSPAPEVSSVSEAESVPVSSEASSAVQSARPSAASIASNNTSLTAFEDEDEFEEEDEPEERVEEVKLDNSPKQAFSTAVTNFGLTMLKQMPRNGESTVLSPVSLAVPLSLLANGARGQSYDELAAVLGIEDITEYNEQFAAYQKFLNENSEFIGTEEKGSERSYLKYGSSIWAKKTVTFVPQFLDMNDLYYGAKLTTLNLNTADAAEQINSWVKEMTEGKVTEIANEEDIKDASSFLVNAIYFKFNWDIKYRGYRDGEFVSYDGSVISANFMASGNNIYINGESVKGFKQSYEGNRYYFAALLPDEGIDIYDFAASLTGTKLQAILKGEKDDYIITWLPKFNIDNKLNCAEYLKSAGVKEIFDSYNADLTGYARDMIFPLYVDKVIQKAGVEVDKNGTVAYAATETRTPPMGGDPIVLKFDRPFLFVVADEKYDIPLFIGIVAAVEPAAGE